MHINYQAQFSGAAPERAGGKGGRPTARRKGHGNLGRGEGAPAMEPNEGGAHSNEGHWATEYQRSGPVQVCLPMGKYLKRSVSLSLLQSNDPKADDAACHGMSGCRQHVPSFPAFVI